MRLLGILLLLAACTANAPVSRHNPHTGVTTHASAIHLLDGQRDAALYARAAVVMRDGAARWVILTSVARSDGNYPRIAAAWSEGRRLPYRRRDRRYTGCTGASGCLREEVGEIRIDRDAFERAATGGVVFQLAGARGAYAGQLPGGAFAEVLSRARP